jgi:hypothetical protein
MTTQINRRQTLTRAGVMLGAAGALGVFAIPSNAVAESQDPIGSPSGSWLSTLSVRGPDGFTFQVLETFDSGGGVVSTGSIDFQLGSKSGPVHGAWVRTGERTFRARAHAFSLDDSGKLNGLFDIREDDMLSNDGLHYSGAGTFEVVNGTGAFAPTHYTVTANRISA